MTNPSIYYYPDSYVLINKANLTDYNKLQKYERTVTYERLYDLDKNPLHGAFDLEHLCHIHRFIFHDIYHFAGKLRTVNISKGSIFFAPYERFHISTQHLFSELKNEKYLTNLAFEKFPDRMSYYMAELNYLHPFRDGNGRSIREFMRILALNAGFYLDWSKVSHRDIFEASVRSIDHPKELSEIIRKTIKKV